MFFTFFSRKFEAKAIAIAFQNLSEDIMEMNHNL